MKEIQRFEDLPLEDKIDIFIQHISGREKEDEIIHLLALFTAYNCCKSYIPERFLEFTIKEMVEHLNNVLINGEDYDKVNEAWYLVIKSLGIDKIWDIIDNIDEYLKSYLDIKYTLERLEDKVMEMFTKM
ncbi:hypothetical protein ABG79_02159 [Caloramator mitchellensis]|uniref:Uncharacterized protein n=1 Tax=Caloramator mitchellensis TaxID=908809 RepID=A0A0R3JRB8_CALMK|nr:hypothetical protein [Caloramator mitchellensis]KRQ86027.1 hypothetical protein ABG79_02159 [Caloramator mitchellensis]